MRTALAVVAVVACGAPSPRARLDNRATDAPEAMSASAWRGCLYARGDLPADKPFVLLLATMRRDDENVDSIVVRVDLVRAPSNEPFAFDARVDHSFREQVKTPLRPAKLAVLHGIFDVVFAGAPAGLGYDNYEVHGVAIPRGHDSYDITLTSSQEPHFYSGSDGRFTMSIDRLHALDQCRFE
jgi:hypothetical protein